MNPGLRKLLLEPTQCPEQILFRENGIDYQIERRLDPLIDALRPGLQLKEGVNQRFGLQQHDLTRLRQLRLSATDF